MNFIFGHCLIVSCRKSKLMMRAIFCSFISRAAFFVGEKEGDRKRTVTLVKCIGNHDKKCNTQTNNLNIVATLRIIILINTSREDNQLKQQLEMSKSHKDCTVEIETKWDPFLKSSVKLTSIFYGNHNYKSYSHTLIMLDEIER